MLPLLWTATEGWAKKRGLPRTMGHAQGARVVEQILEDADHMGIRYLTVYAFSTENWSRPDAEVKALMNLLRTYMKTSLVKCAKNNVRIRVIGDKSRLDDDLQASIKNLEESTAANTGIGFQIAINYGGRDEIVRAVRKIAEDVKNGKTGTRGYYGTDDQRCGRYSRHSGPGSPDPHLRRRTDLQFPALAGRLYGTVFYGYGLARFYERRTGKSSRFLQSPHTPLWRTGELRKR
jgi:hypothetical protein